MNSLNGSILPLSRLLPDAARKRLIEATKVDSRLDPGESERRAQTLDQVLDEVRRDYPQYFQEVK